MNAAQLSKALDVAVAKRVKSISDMAITEIARQVLKNTPIEDGHASRAWLEAFEQIPSIRGKIESPSGLSDDPKAISAGSAEDHSEKFSRKIVVKNSLEFVRKIEYGLPITPIAPGGRKANPVIRPPDVGPLYGERLPTGTGMVVWKDAAGMTHEGLSFTEPYENQHPVGRAIKETKQMLEAKHK